MPSYPYNNNIPQPTDALNKSQGDLLTNFGSIKSLIDVNHYDFANNNAGKHMFVSMPVQSTSPGTASGEMAIFTMNDAASVAQMFIQLPGVGSGGAATNFTGSTQATNGWTRLPSGILLKWGTATSLPQNTLTTVTFPTGATIPVFTNVFMITGSQTFSAGPSTGQLQTIAIIGNFTTTTFQVYPRAVGISGSPVSVCYYAIGI